MQEELTYKDFKIGQKIICYRYDDNPVYWLDVLTIGKTYKIKDLDFHFPNKVCVKCDYSVQQFVPINFFIPDILEERKLKIEKIKNNLKNKNYDNIIRFIKERISR